MTTELTILALTGVLAICQMALQSFTLKAQAGNAWSVGPRDKRVVPTGVAGRAGRAYRNLLEMLPVFAIGILVLHAAGLSTWVSTLGAQLFLAARIAYVPAYLLGWPWVRSLIWNVSMVGVVMVYWPLFF